MAAVGCPADLAAAMPSNEHPSPFGPLQGELAKMMKSNLNGAIKDVDKIIELLENTKAQISQGMSLIMQLERRLINPPV